MNKFTLVETPINDLYLIKELPHMDKRGYFKESFNQRDFASIGLLPIEFVQDNESRSSYMVLRGLHYQKRNPQGKLVRVTNGAVYDVAVDLRKSSRTFGKWYGVTLTADSHTQLYIPNGFAHGFLTLTPTATFIYKCTQYYDPSDEFGLMWNDPNLDITWPVLNGKIVLSDKDMQYPAFDREHEYFV